MANKPAGLASIFHQRPAVIISRHYILTMIGLAPGGKKGVRKNGMGERLRKHLSFEVAPLVEYHYYNTKV